MVSPTLPFSHQKTRQGKKGERSTATAAATKQVRSTRPIARSRARTTTTSPPRAWARERPTRSSAPARLIAPSRRRRGAHASSGEPWPYLGAETASSPTPLSGRSPSGGLAERGGECQREGQVPVSDDQDGLGRGVVA